MSQTRSTFKGKSPNHALNFLNRTDIKAGAGQTSSRTTADRARNGEEAVLKLKGSEWQKLSMVDRERLVEICFRYWRRRGFPYYRLSNSEISREYARLEAVTKECILVEGEIQISMTSLRLANYF